MALSSAGVPATRLYTAAIVFDTLSDKLQASLSGLGRGGRLDEESVSKAMREVRLALLEADVNFEVAKDFTAAVKERALGQDVLKSLSPGQQVVKIVHEELTALMGSGDSRLAFGRAPTVILLAGLQGSGKTTAAAKLALLLRKEGKRAALVACDLQRPAAIDQLEQLGRQIQIPVYRVETQDAVAAARDGLDGARRDGLDVVILDTAGRLSIDEALMDELQRVRDETKPTNVLLVLDAMTGQEAVNVALAFQERIAFDGVVLTKLDGDARGGAALSVKAVTGRPVKLASVGEKLDQLEYFHPDRMASRILGMGDVLTLIEKAEAAVELDEQEEMERRMRAGEFTFDDFLASYRMLRKMGPLQGVLKLVPGLGKQLQGLDVDEKQLARVEAIVLSMTPQERAVPHVISTQRRRRIAAGSGTTLDEVNKLMAARKQMAKMMKQMGKGKMPRFPGCHRRVAMDRHNPRPSCRLIHELGEDGSADQVDARRVEEEPDLPRRRGRLALAAGRPFHRDHRALQPADRPIHDRSRRGEDQGVAGEGCTALRPRVQADQGRRHLQRWLSSSSGSLVGSSTSPTPSASRPRSARTRSCSASTSPRTTSARSSGKQGRIARALRSIVRAGGARAEERYVLEIAG